MQPYKICPRCQSPADLGATQCLQCGRAYRTQFATTSAAMSIPVTARVPNPLKSTALILVSIASALFIMGWIAIWQHNMAVERQMQEYRECLRRIPGGSGSLGEAMQKMFHPQSARDLPASPTATFDAFGACIKPR